MCAKSTLVNPLSKFSVFIMLLYTSYYFTPFFDLIIYLPCSILHCILPLVLQLKRVCVCVCVYVCADVVDVYTCVCMCARKCRVGVHACARVNEFVCKGKFRTLRVP